MSLELMCHVKVLTGSASFALALLKNQANECLSMGKSPIVAASTANDSDLFRTNLA